MIDKIKALFDNEKMAQKKPLRQKNSVQNPDSGPEGQGFENEDKVRLEPVFGIRPGVYLAFIYGLILLAVLFALFFGPGIWRPGSILVLSSEPFGAACRIDGAYWETAPAEVFVRPGKHSIEMVLPGFTPWSSEIEVPGKLFASLFFPDKLRVSAELRSGDPVSAFRDAAAEFAAWTFAGEPSVSAQVPLSLSEGAYRLGPETAAPQVREAMEGILDSSLRFGTTRAAIRDLLRAKFLIDSHGISPSPLGLLGSAAEILALLEDTPGSSLWLSELLAGETAMQIESSSWYAEEISAAETALALIPAAGTARPANSILIEAASTAEPVRFWEVPGGAALQGSLYPREIQFEAFFIADAEISSALWEIFLEAKPEWKSENAGILIQNGFVSEDYLAGYVLPGTPLSDDKNGPVNYVSWHSASAFCEWLGSRLPPAYSGMEIRLPYEAEWEYAAAFMPGMLRNHWEWCADGFAPLELFPSAGQAGSVSPERSVRGGSWFNPANSVNAATRASLPPETCSAFVAFRPVLARKKD